MQQHIGWAAAVFMLVASGVVSACDDAGAKTSAATPVLERALDQLRIEAKAQMQASARVALAQLRSDTATALAQGASTPAAPSIKTGP